MTNYEWKKTVRHQHSIPVFKNHDRKQSGAEATLTQTSRQGVFMQAPFVFILDILGHKLPSFD